jgi:UPF0042 nucleotide-binding protein
MKRLVVISGMAGAGKTVAVDALEDLGFYCIDNLPAVLIDSFVENLIEGKFRAKKVAVALDSRDPEVPVAFERCYERLASHAQVDVLFLEAQEDALVKRFRETRRAHPLNLAAGAATPQTLLEAIQLDTQILAPIRHRAKRVVDTSEMTAHYLRSLVRQAFASDATLQSELRVNIVSFGFKYGIPKDVETTFDVRCFANPYYEQNLRRLTGFSREVQDFVFADENVDKFIDHVFAYLKFMYPLYKSEGKSYFSVGVGCTGGKHRSVAIVERLTQRLRETGMAVHSEHRHFDRE